jgi:tryptophan synthase alpha chain
VKNRIEKKFAELKKAGRKAFVAFVTAGDPDLGKTFQVVDALEKAGVDILELGMPFSDPMADGPVIQKSSERALKAGTSLPGILQAVRKIRKKHGLPILLMGYYNPVFRYGFERFYRDAARAGVDGTLLVDLPPEEGEEARRAAKKNGVSLVYLLAPTSNAERIALVRKKGSGFIYYVSLTGVTGAQMRRRLNSQKPLHRLLQHRTLPVCVGFGVKTPKQAVEAARKADGVVVGSAFVHLLERPPFPRALRRLQVLARSLAKAVHSVK